MYLASRIEEKPGASPNTIFRQVVAQKRDGPVPITPAVLLHAARLLERAAKSSHAHPFQVLVQPQRGQSRRRRGCRPSSEMAEGLLTGPVAARPARSIVFSSSAHVARPLVLAQRLHDVVLEPLDCLPVRC
jgi:hypothetical protein